MRSFFAALAVLATLVLAGCGPGLVALGGGGTGAWLGISSSSDDEKKDSGVVVVENFEPSARITTVIREGSPALVNYDLIDANADMCTVQFQYALPPAVVGDPLVFVNCTMGTGGDPTTNLASTAGGTAYQYRWDYSADIGTQLHQGVTLRARAQDGKQFGDWHSVSGLSVGNDGPKIENINLIGNTGVLLITFSVLDANNDLATLDIEWSIDQAQNWTSVDVGQEVLGNPPEFLPSSPSPGSPGQVIWNSGVALNNFVGNVLLRFAPRDHPGGFSVPTPGTPSVAGPFALNNLTNQPPALQMERSYTGQTFVSRVPIDFTVWDGESDATGVEVSYLLVGQTGAVFEPATMPGEFAAGIAGPFSTTPSPTLYSIQWDALADLGGLAGINTTGFAVQLRLRPADGGQGQEVFTDTFQVFGNTAPAISAIQPLNNFGGVPIVFRAVDSSSDPVSITIEYSTNGTTFMPLTAADFAFGNPDDLQSTPTGRDNLLVWDTLRQFSGTGANHANVLLRVRPTDHPVSATPSADLQGDLFVSGAFPIINDPAGASPVSIEIFTTNNGGPTPSSPQLVTVPLGGLRNFNRSVFPTSAVGFNTFWAVVEGPSYGTLRDLNGSPLAHATGFLTPASPAAINTTGDTFTLGDGITAPVVFEFIKTGSASGSNIAVNIATALTPADVATAMVTAINSSGIRLVASAASSQVNIVHQLACNVGNAIANGGNAPNVQFTGACIASSSPMAGGAAPVEVRYEAPASAPTGSDRVTIRCIIDDPAFFNVQDSHVLHWGDIPASVLVNPSAPLVLVGTSVNFSAQVQPAGAPQGVTWEVVGGFANGTISIGGQYTAPATIPSSNQVTIRAHSVQLGVFGTAQVTLQPEPTAVLVFAAGNVSQLDLSVSPTQPSTLQFTALVQPSNAPQGVNWRILWNNSDYGTGNSTVGTISTMGVYTAPLTLPSPNSVFIQALSQVKPTVYGFRQLDLSAPAPTSFQVAPSPVQVYTNGQGVLFSAVNFAPANANTAVIWSLSQPTGYGSISPVGFYQPPVTYPGAAPLSAVATSALNGSVQATATITLLPPQQTPPSSIVITPADGLTTSSAFGPPLQFVATVAPVQAPQGVTWSIVGTPIGSVTSAGKYTPGASTIDYVETIRAASTYPGSTVMQTVQVSVSGSGHSSTHVADVPMGRADATSVWDSQNNRMWFIGGASESSTPGHEVSVTWYSPSANQFGTGPSLVVPGNVIAITGAFETTASTKRLWAICSSGSASSPVLSVFHLNVATLPVPASWTSVTVGGTSANIPSLGTSVRYPCWYDSLPNQICVMRDSSYVYRFTPGAASVTWSRQAINNTGNGPEQFANTSFCWDDTTRKGYFVGPKERFIVIIVLPVHDGYSTAVHVLDMVPATPSWSVRNTSGAPTVGISNGTLFKGSAPNILWFFGGRDDDSSPVAYNNNLWRINVGVNPATFTQMTTSGNWPSARMSATAGITTTPGGGVLLGGRNSAGGVHGDLWRFSETPSHFTRPSPAGILPQGRSHAAGVVNAGRGFVYGGITSTGVSNELWSFTLSGGVPAWVLETTSGTPPPGLIRASVVVDTVNQVLYLFGGTTSEKDAANNAVQDLYTLNLQTKAWSKPTPSGSPPSARYGAAMCATYNLTTGAVTALYVYGGQDNGGLKGDLWRLTVSGTPAWQQVTPTNAAPDARHGATIGWDSRRDRLFVVGGFSTPSGANRQCHQYDLATNAWSSPPTDDNTQAEFVFESGAAYDVVLRRFFHAPAGKAKNQALVVTSINPTWQQLVAPSGGTSQNQMTGTTGLYDPLAGRYYAVFGERAVGARAVGTNGMRWLMVK